MPALVAVAELRGPARSRIDTASALIALIDCPSSSCSSCASRRRELQLRERSRPRYGNAQVPRIADACELFAELLRNPAALIGGNLLERKRNQLGREFHRRIQLFVHGSTDIQDQECHADDNRPDQHDRQYHAQAQAQTHWPRAGSADRNTRL